jgi:hypothetical protein
VCQGACYIEFWNVDRKGSVSPKNADFFWFPDCPNTYGFNYQFGIGIFIPTSWLENNKVVFGDVFPKPWVKNAGVLPSACLENKAAKDLWQKAFSKFGANATKRESATAWNCCCKDPFGDGFSTATPDVGK